MTEKPRTRGSASEAGKLPVAAALSRLPSSAHPFRDDIATRGLAIQADLLDLLFENLSEGISMVDADLNVVAFNRRFLELLDFPAGMFRFGDSFEKFIRFNAERGEYGPGDVSDLVRERLDIAGRFEAHSFERERPDGRILRIKGTPLPGGGFVTVYMDVTEQKHAERDRTESETRFRNLVEGSVQGVVIRAEGEVLFMNDAYARILGYGSAEEFVPICRGFSHVAPPDRDRVRGFAAERMKGRPAPQSYEFRVVRKDGRIIWLENHVRTVEWQGRRAIQSTVVDITERKQAEEALRLSEARFRTFAETASDWFWETDAAGRFTYASHSFYEATGLTEAELIGTSRKELFERLYKAGGETGWNSHFEDFEAHRPFRNVTIRFRRHDGCEVLMLSNGTPTFNSRGRFIGYRGTAMDITALKSAEVELREALAEAEAANDAKRSFLAKMSHELRTPLNAIIGLSDIMGRELFGPLGSGRYVEYARDISSSGHYLLELINDILDVSKIEAGEYTLNTAPTAVDQLVRDCVQLIRPTTRGKSIRVRTDIARNLPLLDCDSRAVRQILLNLLSNAAKFTPAGGRIGVRCAVDGRGRLRISVSDSGPGIPPEDIAKVAEPFSQVRSVDVAGQPGSGLGLSIAKSLIELHGGTLLLKSALNKGTRATVVFPADRM